MGLGAIGTYSIVAVQGTATHPDVGTTLIGGAANGLASVTFSWNTERSTLQRMPDGTIVTNIHRGDDGRVVFDVALGWPTDEFFLDWNNTIDTALALNSVITAALGVIIFADTTTGDSYTATGCSIAKQPDIVYGDEQPRRVWTFNVSSLHHD